MKHLIKSELALILNNRLKIALSKKLESAPDEDEALDQIAKWLVETEMVTNETMFPTDPPLVGRIVVG